MNTYAVGDSAIIKREIREDATGDHPEFLLGQKGDMVIVEEVSPECVWPYSVRVVGKKYGSFQVSADEIAKPSDPT